MSVWLGIDPWWEYALVPLVVGAILVLMLVVRAIAARFGTGAEVQRKIVHVAVGLSSLTFPLVFSSPGPVLLLTAAAVAVMLALRHGLLGSMGEVIHGVERASHGEIYMALVVALLFFRSEGAPVLYVLPILVITLSDTASALVGTAYGRLRFPVEDGHKSVEGVVAFFMVTVIASLCVLLLLSDAGRLNVIVLAFLIAAFCALVEADSWRGLDNLFVPVGAHLLLARHLDTEPGALLLLALGFGVAVILALRYAGTIGLTRHAARSYVILLFLILSVTTPLNAVLPIAAVAAHLAVRRLNPCRSPRPDLDLLAAATGAALLWLAFGEWLGLVSINLFSATFAGVACTFAALAVTGRADRVPVLLAGGLFLALVIVVALQVVAANPVHASWYGTVWIPVALSIAIGTAVALAWPAWFARYRSPKAFAVAGAAPVAILLTGAFA